MQKQNTPASRFSEAKHLDVMREILFRNNVIDADSRRLPGLSLFVGSIMRRPAGVDGWKMM
jgi:hypothetical protein